MNLLKSIAAKTWGIRNRLYLSMLRKRLKNKDFSLITNNCVGGVIYHNLNVKFLSPTVNLWMTPEDYLLFANDLQCYLSCELKEIKKGDITYPVGELSYGADKVTIYFMHYDCFKEAKEKWENRSKRINLDNLFFILDYPATNDSVSKQIEIKEKFDALPYQNKVMLTKTGVLQGKDIVNCSFYDSEYKPGLILTRRNDYCIKRYLDDFDYVGFLNQPCKRC